MTLTIAFAGEPKQEVAVPDYRTASEVFVAHRDRGAYGASAMLGPCGRIRENGRLIAYVSYNGKVWAGSPRDWPKTTPLYEPEKRAI